MDCFNFSDHSKVVRQFYINLTFSIIVAPDSVTKVYTKLNYKIMIELHGVSIDGITRKMISVIGLVVI